MNDFFAAGWADTFSWVIEIWQKPLLIIDKNPITLKTIIVGLFLFGLGYFICRSAAKVVGRNVLTRLDIDHSLRATLQTIIFYFLLVILTFIVLGVLNIPITIFTLLGGALAIGVGLGAQNIVNNFISGLVMMIERPVKVGDFVELEGLSGRVENIGARSTQIKSLDNTHYVVPNSYFLEKNVLNWTLSDDLIRSKVGVGVAYGSETDRVETLLKQAASEEDQVLTYPEPLVMFKDFGDSSLVFEVYFWTHLRGIMELKVLQSRMRYRIDHLFRENDVVISFPQRDVHLYNTAPFQVEVLPQEAPPAKT